MNEDQKLEKKFSADERLQKTVTSVAYNTPLSKKKLALSQLKLVSSKVQRNYDVNLDINEIKKFDERRNQSLPLIKSLCVALVALLAIFFLLLWAAINTRPLGPPVRLAQEPSIQTIVKLVPPSSSSQEVSGRPEEWILRPSMQSSLRGAMQSGLAHDANQSTLISNSIISTDQKISEVQKMPVVAVPSVSVLKLSQEEIKRLIDRAEIAIKNGDISSARNFLERAIRSNQNTKAAFMLAETYDPYIIAQWGVKGGIRGQVDRARELYGIAASAGAADAASRIERLSMRP